MDTCDENEQHQLQLISNILLERSFEDYSIIIPKVLHLKLNFIARLYLNRLVNAVGKRHLGMKIDSSQYIKPAVSYIKELITLASEKGFIMSRVNARQISNRLSDMINNDIINPILKVTNETSN